MKTNLASSGPSGVIALYTLLTVLLDILVSVCPRNQSARSNTPISSLTTSSLKPRKYRLSSSALLTTLILMLLLTMTATPRFTGLVPWVEYALSSCFSLQARQSLLVIMPNKLLLCAASCFQITMTCVNSPSFTNFFTDLLLILTSKIEPFSTTSPILP